MIRHIRRLALLVLCLLLLSSAAALAEEKTYIEFIFDASFSMDQKVDGRRTRMDVAKEVMEELIEGLEDQPGLEIALRVYGSKMTDVVGCKDSILMQEFGPVGKVRPSILKTIKKLKPAGMTPIGYSLELAAKDFPKAESNRNVIVLITDGEESCNADPCAISKRLQDEGLVLRPYVVGFALSSLEEASVRCIGNYYPAYDRESLLTALQSIMVEVVSPPALVVEAWAGGVNVTRETRIELLDFSGYPVPFDKLETKPEFVKLTVDEGTYIVQGTLAVGPDELTVRKSNVFVESDQTTKVVLDFGDLNGRVFLTAYAGGQDVSNQVDIRVEQTGRPVRSAWSGFPPQTTLQAGVYDFVVTLPIKGHEPLMKRVSGRVSPKQDTELRVDLGELPASLEVRAVYRDQDITSQCTLEINRDGLLEETFAKGKKSFRYDTAPGVLDLKAEYHGDVKVGKRLTGVVLKGGETTRATIDFGDVLGTLRIRVLAGDEDVTREAAVEVAGEDVKLQPALRGNYREVLVRPGVYGVKGSYRGIPSRLAEAEVRPGEVIEVTLTIELPGKIVLAPSAGGRPIPPGKVSAWVVDDNRIREEFSVSLDRLEAVL
ncbi:MAG: VWA domain-containing protein, partial [Firmicutes bacterium]|nr:VWA domain-containing protein [Bacillota bacterium]